MQADVRVITKVLPGNKVKIELPEGYVGEDVEVIVVFPQALSTGRRNVLKLLEDIRSRHPQRSAEDIERDLAAETSWDS
jgi:hypothetical protein